MSEGGKTARSDLLGGAGWAGFGLLIVTEALRMDRFTSMGATLYTMPGFVPGIIGSLITLLGAVLMLRGWQRSRAEGKSPDASTSTEPVVNRRVGFTLALSLVYAGALLGRAPFWLVTIGLIVSAVAPTLDNVVVLGLIVRTVAPQIHPAWYLHWLHLAATCWLIGFAILAWRYVPFLTQARIDGKEH